MLRFYLSHDIKMNLIFGVKRSRIYHILRNVKMDVIT